MQYVQTHTAFQAGPPCELALCVTRVACSLVHPCGRKRVLDLSFPKGFIWHVRKALELPPFFSTKLDHFLSCIDICFLKATPIRVGSQAVPGRLQKLGQILSGAVLGGS